MNLITKGAIAAVLISAVLIYKNNADKNKSVEKTMQTETVNQQSSNFAGDYVSNDYKKRNEGYDWVAVSVKKTSDSTIHIAVRSRADKKKPTCTFDADATLASNGVYKTVIEGKTILYTFKGSTLNIATEKVEDKNLLNYYCSGGGSLADTYEKISEPLDEKQIDLSVFNKTLSLQNINFNVRATGKGSIQELTIQPYGLKTDQKKVTLKINGSVSNAEIEDLNSDGFPEILMYTTSAGSGSYGNVIGYSVNNGKSMSQIYFPPISENAKASEG